MCITEIKEEYNPPLKTVIAYGVFRKNNVLGTSPIGVTYKKGIFSEYDHPYEKPYSLNKRYKSKFFEGTHRSNIGYILSPSYEPGFHKFRYYRDATSYRKTKNGGNRFVVAKVKLENVRLLGDSHDRQTYVADHMTILKIY